MNDKMNIINTLEFWDYPLFNIAALASIPTMAYAGFKNEKYRGLLTALIIFNIIVVILLTSGYRYFTIGIALTNLLIGFVSNFIIIGSSWYFAYQAYQSQ